MEEKNELNDIILSKGGANSNSKKLLLAIAALTLILIIVLVIMNSLKTQSDVKPPVAAVPPTPTSPKEIVDDPLFEPVKVIQEGEGNSTEASAGAPATPSAPQDLGKIAQKIKQESMQNAPAQERVVQPAPAAPVQQSIPAPQPKAVSAPAAAPVPAPAKVTSKAAPATTQKTEKPVVNTPTIKTAKPAEPKKEAEPKKATVQKSATEAPAAKTAEKAPADAATKPAAETPAPKTAVKAEESGVWYIQVGSFTKEPNKALFDRLNASGLKYTTVPAGTTTKVMVGPFQGKKAAQDVLGNVKRNIESGAYPTPAQK